MTVHCLDTNLQMKIKPAIGKRSDVLFEIQDGESMTICCRVSRSHDLVVRDFYYGSIMYCISGAEISDHLIEVYLSCDKPIGTIKDGVVDAHQYGIVTIQDHGQHQYTMDQTIISVQPGHVSLCWPPGWPNEFKALSIAFALQIAMTKCKEIVFNAEAIKAQPVVQAKVAYSLSAGVQEGCPKINRHEKPRTFLPDSPITDFLLTASCMQRDNLYTVGFLMTQLENRIVGRIKYTSNIGTGQAGFIVHNSHGGPEVLAEWISRKDLASTRFLIKYDDDKSCEGIFQLGSKEYIFRNQTGNFMSSKSTQGRGTYQKDFFDSEGKKCGEFRSNVHSVLAISFANGVPFHQKKAILAAGIHWFGEILGNFRCLPIAEICYLRCNCNCCQKPSYARGALVPSAITYLNVLFSLKAVGHNKQNNLIYFNLYSSEEGRVFCTLEVTPVDNFKGVAKIVGKAASGTILFTAIDHHNDKFMPIYDHKNQLLACFASDGGVYNHNGEKELEVTTATTGKQLDESRYGPNIKCCIYNNSKTFHSTIASQECCVNIQRLGAGNQLATCFQMYTEIALAARTHFNLFRFDRIPTPEIVYCYC